VKLPDLDTNPILEFISLIGFVELPMLANQPPPFTVAFFIPKFTQPTTHVPLINKINKRL
jgi:hypothetical protein